MKAFFFAEVGVQLGNFERRFLVEDAVNDQRWGALEERLRSVEAKNEELLRSAEATNAAQWAAIEQLLLALFRQPEARTTMLDVQNGALEESARRSGADLSRAHAANNIR